MLLLRQGNTRVTDLIGHPVSYQQYSINQTCYPRINSKVNRVKKYNFLPQYFNTTYAIKSLPRRI